MKLFYTVLFCAVGAFNILAAVLDIKWYIGCLQKNGSRSRGKVRFFVCLAGILLVLYGIAYYAGWI
jgi:hypothetical protein